MTHLALLDSTLEQPILEARVSTMSSLRVVEVTQWIIRHSHKSGQVTANAAFAMGGQQAGVGITPSYCSALKGESSHTAKLRGAREGCAPLSMM